MILTFNSESPPGCASFRFTSSDAKAAPRLWARRRALNFLPFTLGGPHAGTPQARGRVFNLFIRHQHSISWVFPGPTFPLVTTATALAPVPPVTPADAPSRAWPAPQRREAALGEAHPRCLSEPFPPTPTRMLGAAFPGKPFPSHWDLALRFGDFSPARGPGLSRPQVLS